MSYIYIIKKGGNSLTCGPIKLTGMQDFWLLYTSTNDSSRRNRWMSIQRPSCFFNPSYSCSSRQIQRRRDRLLPPPVQASPPPTTPTAGQGIPLLTHTPCYSAVTAASHRSRTSEPSYSSLRGHPLPRLPRIRVVPFLASPSSTAQVLSARRGQRGQGTTSIGRVLSWRG